MTATPRPEMSIEQMARWIPDCYAMFEHIRTQTLPKVETRDLLDHAESLVHAVRESVDIDDDRLDFANFMHQQHETFGHAHLGPLGTLHELEILIERPELIQEAARELHTQLRRALLADMPPLTEDGAAVIAELIAQMEHAA